MKILNIPLISVAISLVFSATVNANTVNLILKHKDNQITKYSKISESKKAMQHTLAALP